MAALHNHDWVRRALPDSLRHMTPFFTDRPTVRLAAAASLRDVQLQKKLAKEAAKRKKAEEARQAVPLGSEETTLGADVESDDEAAGEDGIAAHPSLQASQSLVDNAAAVRQVGQPAIAEEDGQAADSLEEVEGEAEMMAEPSALAPRGPRGRRDRPQRGAAMRGTRGRGQAGGRGRGTQTVSGSRQPRGHGKSAVSSSAGSSQPPPQKRLCTRGNK